MLLPQLAQHVEVPAPLLAKGIVVPDDQLLHVQALDHVGAHELLWLEPGHVAAEGQAVGPVQPQAFHDLQLLGGQGDKGRGAPLEHPQGVGVEGDGHTGQPLLPGLGQNALEQGLVAGVHAVEVADGHAGAGLHQRGKWFERLGDQHGD